MYRRTVLRRGCLALGVAFAGCVSFDGGGDRPPTDTPDGLGRSSFSVTETGALPVEPEPAASTGGDRTVPPVKQLVVGTEVDAGPTPTVVRVINDAPTDRGIRLTLRTRPPRESREEPHLVCRGTGRLATGTALVIRIYRPDDYVLSLRVPGDGSDQGDKTVSERVVVSQVAWGGDDVAYDLHIRRAAIGVTYGGVDG